MVSLDGYFEGVDHDLSWHNIDEEFNDNFIIPQTKKVGTILFGRRTYEMMASFWPSEEAKRTDPVTSKIMTETEKFVFSKTLKKVDWEHTTLVSGRAIDQINRLKEQQGGDIAIFGSNNLMVSLVQSGLIDEFRIIINPVVLGKGTLFFHGIKEKFGFKLLYTKQFKNGNVLLTYSSDNS